MSDTVSIETAPPSAKLVFKVLEYNGALTQKEIVDRSMLSQRTVRDALTRLRDLGVVSKEVYIPDARQNLYKLTTSYTSENTQQATAETF